MTKRIPNVLSALTALTLIVASGCEKTKETANPDEVTTNTDPVEEPEKDPAALPPQDPDPAEIAALFDRYLKGDYEAVASEAETLRGGLTADTQVRAHALASAIRALAAIENVPEDGKAAAEEAVSNGDRLADPEVQQLAHIAHGSYLVRVHEAANGQSELEAALALTGPYGPLAQLMLGEAHLNQAFGSGDDEDKIQNPAKLDDARTAYQAALDGGPDIIKAHAHEGLAAIAKYKNEKEAICTHAQEAENMFVAAGATDYVREVPQLLAGEGKCKAFTKAK
ncbi:MAG TPA: hypothetical protein VM869_16585 [Enhygromyxa sp.]|nr:hypothetical protein [Enhygromyxa sp.]